MGPVTHILIVDNNSQDSSVASAQEALKNYNWSGSVSLICNKQNVGLGGSHKIAFDYCLDHSLEYCLVLHGDDQGDLTDFNIFFSQKEYSQFDFIFGSRFSNGSRLPGYSFFKIFGNTVFNILSVLITKKNIEDFGGSGLNLYRVTALVSADGKREYLFFPSDFLFHSTCLLFAIRNERQFTFAPISWTQLDQVSNMKYLRESLRYLETLLKFLFDRNWLSAK